MAINTRTLVLAAAVENAAGIPLQKGLPIALIASTMGSMQGLVVALLLGQSFKRSSAPTGFSIVAPGGTSTTPVPSAGAPKIKHLRINDTSGNLEIDGENFGTRKTHVTLAFAWPAGSHHMTTETMPLARHKGIDLSDEIISIPISDLPEATAGVKVAVVVIVNSVASNTRDIDFPA
jgi:hypothetical protein